MNFDLSEAQSAILQSVDRAIDEAGGTERAQLISQHAGYDDVLDEQLISKVDLSSADLQERVLVAERLAELGTATTFGLRAVLSYGVDLPDGPVAVTDAGRDGLVRYAGVASAVLVIGDEGARLASLSRATVTAVRSGFGYPLGRIEPGELSSGLPVMPRAPLRPLFRLAMSAEIAGLAAAGITKTASHLRQRRQFGRALAGFQALRHRLAEAAVSAEATRWLVRQAASSGEPRMVDLAASYAADCASQLAPELTQLCGARSFVREFGLCVFTMRIEALRLELGSRDRLALAVLRHDR